jgi:ABC-type Zn uptake system ZnuABC Zn-binding protein ZnuA
MAAWHEKRRVITNSQITVQNGTIFNPHVWLALEYVRSLKAVKRQVTLEVKPKSMEDYNGQKYAGNIFFALLLYCR